MKHTIILFTFFLLSLNLCGQTNYTGFIDKYPIELVTDVYSDGEARAVYVYSNHDEPIEINGKLEKGKLTLYEKDKDGKNQATLTFENFDAKSKQVEGYWKDLKSKKDLKISLIKKFEIDNGENIEWTSREIIQSVSLKDKYFKLVISKGKGNFYPYVSGIKIVEKKTDKLLQEIEIEGQLFGLNNISVEDYNFDGIADFSVFEQSYAGPNTSRIYFLYDPKTKKYFESSFTGTSLQFDQKAKRIYEHNQCCAGRSHLNAEYKVVNNKMVLIKQTCLELDDKTGEFKKVKCN